MSYKKYLKRDAIKNYFPLPNEIFCLKQVADLLGHSTSQITELYYVKKDTSRLNGVTEGFEM